MTSKLDSPNRQERVTAARAATPLRPVIGRPRSLSASGAGGQPGAQVDIGRCPPRLLP